MQENESIIREKIKHFSKEVDASEIMIERVEDRFALKPNHVAGDAAYGTEEMLGWLVDREIDPHIPVRDRSTGETDTFSCADVAYDKDRDLNICPGGKELKTLGTVHDGTTIKYIAKRGDCAICPLMASSETGGARPSGLDNNSPHVSTQPRPDAEVVAW
jgi:hypothetical protein